MALQITDTNAVWGVWPIQRTSFPTLHSLDKEYERLGIGEVWLSAAASILAPEPDESDDVLFSQMAVYPRFRPVKTINPILANWESALRQSVAHHGIVAVKLFPTYHGYSLDKPFVDDLCELCAALNLPVLIQIRVNDERNQPDCLQVAGVPTESIANLSIRHPSTSFIALSPYLSELDSLAGGGENLRADLSYLDAIKPLERAKQRLPISRLVFGSGALWLVPNAARLKLDYCKLPQEEIAAIAAENLSPKTILHD